MQSAMVLLSAVLAVAIPLTVLAQSGTSPCSDKACLTGSISLNTGVDYATSTLYPLGAQDAYWELISSPDSNVTVPSPAYVIPPNAAWTTMPNSEWISAYSNSSWNSNDSIVPYVFRRCFCVCGPQAIIHIHFQMLVDNGDSVFLDGGFLATNGMNNSPHAFQIPFTVDTILHVASGSHCLTFNVHNLSGVAMGLDVAGTITSTTAMFLSDTCCEPFGSICGRKIWDKNCNGKDDNPPNDPNVEPGIPGWTFILNPGNHVITTDTNGYFCFDQLAPGTYTIGETSQPGWHQSFPPGVHTVQVVMGQVTQVEFLNCKDTITDCSQYVGKGQLDSSCCQYSFPISSGMGNISKLNYVVTGGTIVQITTSPCTPSSTVPPSLYGTTSGTLNYSPPCASGLSISVQAAPNTASGQICIQWTAYHPNAMGTLDSCTFTTCFACERMQQSRCDSLSSMPFTDPNNSLDWRRFTIWNQKIPLSPISKILIALSPVPCTGSWQGGRYVAGTHFNGATVCGGKPNKSDPYFGAMQHYVPFANDWFRTPYTTLPNAIVTSLNEQHWAAFDIGVDYTCSPAWTGTVTFTVIHCDGDTCLLTYGPWTASPPAQPCLGCQPIRLGQIAAKLYAWQFQVNNSKQQKPIKYLTLETDNPADQIFAGSGTSIPGQQDTNAEELQDYRQGHQSCLFSFASPIGMNELSGYINIVIAHDTSVPGPPIVKWITYDSSGTPIFSDTTSFRGGTSVVGSTTHAPGSPTLGIISISPNPTNGPVLISYSDAQPGMVHLDIYDELGKTLLSQDEGYAAPGMHSATIDVGSLPAGKYYCRLASGSAVDTQPFVVVK